MTSLEHFIGNERLVQLLRRRGRWPQAMLFTGPEGVGKRTLALALAQLANCKNPIDQDYCGRCSSCIKAAAGHHPDILMFQPERNLIRIDVMREMNREAHFRPFEGRLRFFIVDEAEKMNEEAANSILKTLEEPPDTSRIILISAFPQRLLSTIRSRCQTFTFRPLDRSQIESFLRRHPKNDVELRAAFADGSIGKALALDLEETLQDRNLMLDLLTNWIKSESFEGLYKACEQPPLKSELKSRERTIRYLEILEGLGEDLYTIKVERTERVVNRDRFQELGAIAREVTLDWIRDFLYHSGQAKWEIEHYLNPLMSFETLWLRRKSHAGNHYS